MNYSNLTCPDCGQQKLRLIDHHSLHIPYEKEENRTLDSEVYGKVMCDNCYHHFNIIGNIEWVQNSLTRDKIRDDAGDEWHIALSHDAIGRPHVENCREVIFSVSRESCDTDSRMIGQPGDRFEVITDVQSRADGERFCLVKKL